MRLSPFRSWMIRLAVIATAVAVPLADVAPASADSFTDTSEQIFINKVNELRGSRGLRPLAVDAELSAIAERWAQHMANNGALSHNMNLPREVRTRWTRLGENVGTGVDSFAIFDAFVASPTHYANLVERSFTKVGVAVVVGPDGRMYTAHEFMATKAAPKTRRVRYRRSR